MGLIDSVKSRFKNKEDEELEREFERAFREGGWPDDEDFYPLASTGNLIPAEPDPRPAQPAEGWAQQGDSQSQQPTSVYAIPVAPSPFGVIGAEAKPLPYMGVPLGMQDAQDTFSKVTAEVHDTPKAQAPQNQTPTQAEYSAEFEAMGMTSPSLFELTEPGESASKVVRAPRATVAAIVPTVNQNVQPGDEAPLPGEQASNVPAFIARQKKASARKPDRSVAPYADDVSSAGAYPSEGGEWDRVPAPASRGAARRESKREAQREEHPKRSPYDVADESVRVYERSEDRTERRDRRASSASAPKSFAERFREKAISGGSPSHEPARQSRGDAQQPDRLGQRSPRDRGNREPVRPAPDPARSDMWNAHRIDRGGDLGGFDRGESRERSYGTDRPTRSWDRRPSASYDSRDRDDAYRRPVTESRSYDRGGFHTPAMPSPCEVVRPRRYDDVSEIAQYAIGEHKPVVIVLSGTQSEVTRRILDFSFGMCCASGARLEELEHRVYALLPRDTALSESDMTTLRRQGILRG